MVSDMKQMTYTHTEQDIHEFVFHESSRDATEAFWKRLSELAVESGVDDTYRIVMDVCESGQQPLRYFFSRAGEMARDYPPDTRGTGRIVLIYKDAMLLGTIESFLRVLNPPKIRVRFFSMDRREEAIQWLLSDHP